MVHFPLFVLHIKTNTVSLFHDFVVSHSIIFCLLIIVDRYSWASRTLLQLHSNFLVLADIWTVNSVC